MLHAFLLLPLDEDIVVKSHYRSHEIGLWNNKLAEYVHDHPDAKLRGSNSLIGSGGGKGLSPSTIPDNKDSSRGTLWENAPGDEDDSGDVEVYPGWDGGRGSAADDHQEGPTVLIAGDPGGNRGGSGGSREAWISFR